MLWCVLLLAGLGSSTCFRRDDFPGLSSRPTKPSYKPGHWDPGYNAPPSSSSASWHHGHHDAAGWPNAGGGQTHHEQPKPSHSVSHYDQTGFYAHDWASDEHSDTSSSEETDQGGGVLTGTGDQVENPFQFNNPGSGTNVHRRKNPEATDKNQNGGNKGQNVGQVNRPLDFNIHAPTANLKNGTSQPETGQAGTKPFDFNNFDLRNGGDIPEADNSKGERNVTKPTRNIDGNQSFKPVANLTNETNETLTQAYITGPDNTLHDVKGNKSLQDTLKLSTAILNKFKGAEPGTLKTPTRDSIPSTPRPSIGSRPVPDLGAILGQGLAPALQWNVGIYTKTVTPYEQICGGSLVKADTVLTAAHCFWSDGAGALRPALFAAAAGKLRRAWDAASDTSAQQSDISELHIPPRFQGALSSFQDDIAVARLAAPFALGPGVRPVCLNFDQSLEKEQFQGSMGTIVGWGLTEPDGPPSERLNFLELPYLEIGECIKRMQPAFLKYITSDKICAGDFRSGRAACKGDSGAGLVFTTGGRPYLRGVVSAAPRDRPPCNAHTPAVVTHVAAHATFLAEHVPDIDEDCRSAYEDRSGVVEAVVTPAAAVENSQITLNVTVKSGDGKLQEPFPLPLTSSTGFECKCICN